MTSVGRIVITGANGFVGRAMCATFLAAGLEVCATTRHASILIGGLPSAVVGDLDGNTEWEPVLTGCHAVVHLAARVHVMKDVALDPLSEFRRVNVQGTLHLARQAVAAGVRRFIYLSSIKVNGESTAVGCPFNALDAPHPLDAYAVSKMEAEQGLLAMARQTGMEVVVIRPPLVYGPGVKANFATMMRWVRLGVPLPLGAIKNQRSLVALDNLVDFTMTCLTHPAAANEIFLVSDGEDVSTTELLQRMGLAMGRPARLLPVPVKYLQWLAAVSGQQNVIRRLCDSLQVDIEKNLKLLQWTPPVTLDQGLKKVVVGGAH